jgi:phosphonate transport system substrate-binding protein
VIGITRRTALCGIAATACLPGAPGAAPPSARAGATPALSFGLTPVFLSSDLVLLERLRAYLEAATARPVRLVTRRTYQEITALLVSGQLDAAWICGYPFVAYGQRLALVATPVWRGAPLYRSYLVVDARREAEGLADLAGDVHAFSDPDSNSGWLVTAAALAAAGSTPDRHFGETIFTWGHRNVIRAVAAGLAQSGSVDGYVYEVMRETEPDLIARTRVLATSEPLGFPPIACTASAVASPEVAALRSALLAMPQHPDGRAVLETLRLDGFRIVPESLYDPIADLMALALRTGG